MAISQITKENNIIALSSSLDSLQGRRNVYKSDGASSNMVGILSSPRWNRVNWSAKIWREMVIFPLATPQVPTALIQRVGGFISYGCMERCKAQISAQFPPRASHFQLFFHFSSIQFQFVTVPDCVHLCLYRTVR